MTLGKVFASSLPIEGDTENSRAVLVTAAHVLDGIGGDTATLLLRRKDSAGTYTPFPFNFKIRAGNTALYIKHETADVAAMFIAVPDEKLPITVLPPNFLVDDTRIEQLEIHPGDEVFCLGFPLFARWSRRVSLFAWWTIGIYPLTPMKTVKEWDVDVILYDGNSGGPVYFHYENRRYAGSPLLGFQRGVLGLVIQQVNSAIPDFKPLNYGVIVPAQFVKEVLDKLGTAKGENTPADSSWVELSRGTREPDDPCAL